MPLSGSPVKVCCFDSLEGGAKGSPKGVQGQPRGALKVSGKSKKASRGSPGGLKRGPEGALGGHGGGKATGNWILYAAPLQGERSV